MSKLPSLYKITDEMIELSNALDDPDNYDENGEILPVLQEQLEMVNQDFTNKAMACSYIKQSYDNDINEIDAEIKRLQSLKQSKIRAQNRINELILSNMNRLGLVEIKNPTRILKITNSVSAEVYDMTKLPQEYLRTKTEVLPDKNKIKEDIKKGIDVNGAKLITTQHLKIK